MITGSFDDKTQAKLNPDLTANAPKVEACIITFSKRIEQYVLENYPCTQLGWSRCSCGDMPIYCVDPAGKRFAFFLSYEGAARCTAVVERGA